MCTVLTVSVNHYSDKLVGHILRDAANNSHGFALVLIDENGSASLIRSLEISVILAALKFSPWERMFLHSRWATQGEISLANTHGWEASGYIYMHNGCLWDPEATNYAVDSQLIGAWIDTGGVDYALDCLQQEPYANVLIVDPEHETYYMSRSKMGSLYTDWEGNYSTNPFGRIKFQVPDDTTQAHWTLDKTYGTHPVTVARRELASKQAKKVSGK